MNTPSATNQPAGAGRGVMKAYIWSGLIIIFLMLLDGLAMRTAQAGWMPPLNPDWFYALLSLHGAGMVVGFILCGMGAIWYLLRRHIDLNKSLAIAALLLNWIGVVFVLVSTLIGKYAGLYTVLMPLPFKGSWPSWATGVFLLGLVFVNIGWMIWCMQMLGGCMRAFGGLRGAIGWDYVWSNKKFKEAGKAPPPPEAFAAFLAGLDGLICGVAAMLVVTSLVIHWIDPKVLIDNLWAKNLIYFFAHTMVNLVIYMLAGVIYVALPYATKRQYHTSIILVIGWWCSTILTLTNYFHHLYMDFAQANILSYAGQLSSYLSALPVTAVTVAGALMLVWRSRIRWSLGAIFLYSGIIGWVVGGIGAEIDASIAFNVHLHNTLWVPAHFHTYLLGGCLLFVLGWVFLLLESRSSRVTSASIRWLLGLLIYGGMTTFLLGFYVAGALGVPRRYAVEPGAGPLTAQIGTIGATIMIIGFILAFFEGVSLRRNRQADLPVWPEPVTGRSQ
ncbi:MAG: cbb3-type cytochrome c oxidase subunit I [Phycisphaerales bacterium]|nr:cbb3-type cytochrome c oxidase subunit I [Phycisphaerales bacterium]